MFGGMIKCCSLMKTIRSYVQTFLSNEIGCSVLASSGFVGAEKSCDCCRTKSWKAKVR